MNVQMSEKCGIIDRVAECDQHSTTLIHHRKVVSMTMSSYLSTFHFNGQTELRALADENGDPWIAAADACAVLGLNNVGQALSRLDDDEKRDIISSDVTGRQQPIAFINESGLFTLILTSRKAEAKVFRKWVTSEVLPALRKTGTYSVKPLSPAQQLLMAAQQLVDHEQRLADAEARLEAIETAQLALSSGERFYTIKGYYAVKHLGAIDNKEALAIGRRASKLSRAKGVSIGKASDPLWGEVNTYLEGVLDELLGVKVQ